jgi:hypothetical protein
MHNCLILSFGQWSKVAEFFLIPGESGAHPWHDPQDKHSRPASDCNLSDATSIVPAALAALAQSASLGT